jgi:FkbM family methyltransferase
MAFKEVWRPLIPFPRRKTIRRWLPAFETRKLVNLIKNARTDLVVDVGANCGQYATAIRSAGWRGRIISIEPLGDAHRQLMGLAQRDPEWRIAGRMAAGDVDAEVQINCFNDSSMSSLLLPSRETAGVESLELRRTETVPIRRLDDILKNESAERIFLKIDVQGTELDVLAGAEGMLAKVKAIQMELALRPIYQGEPSYLDVLQRLNALDFVPVFFLSVLKRPRLDPDWQTDVVSYHRSLF